VPTPGRGRETIMEHLFTTGSLGNNLSWGDQQIPEPAKEAVDIHAIAYDRKRKVVMKRTIRKKKLTLDSTLFITTEETLFDTKSAKMIDLIGARMTITDATLDRAKMDEREVAVVKKELDHL
jgi:hypothetical protein